MLFNKKWTVQQGPPEMNKLYRIIWADNLSPFSISLSVRQIRLHWFSHQWPSTHKKSKVCTTYQICTFGAGDYPPSNSNYSVDLNETLLGVKRPSEFAKWSKALPHPAPHRSLFWLTWLLDLERVCVIFWCDIKEKDLSWKWLKRIIIPRIIKYIHLTIITGG